MGQSRRNYYGTLAREVAPYREHGIGVLLDIDVQGWEQVTRRCPDAVSIFILAPSRQILEQRLRDRSEDSDAVIERRLRDAAREIRNYGQYDYVLINNDLQSSAESPAAIVRAERMRRVRFEVEFCEVCADVRKESKE